jgi:tripartite-type tricarboxylate transporter receptor subunit TctC
MAMTRLAAVVALAIAATAGAHAQQDYPNRPVRLVVPFPPGGGNDTLGRIVAQRLTPALGQQVIVDNRPGAGGNIGTDQVAKSPPDGYTLTLGFVANFAMTPSLQKVAYDPLRDFAPISLVALSYQILVVHPSLPAKSVQELVALAKAKPGFYNYGSGGNGSPLHLAAELFKQAASIDVVHVPYKGSAPAAAAILAGDTQMLFGGLVSSLPHVRTGKLRALAVTAPKRMEAAPDVPTLAELGYQGVEPSSWYGLFAPAGTPAAIVQRLNREVVAFSAQPDYREQLRNQGQEATPSTPEELARFVKTEFDKYARVIRAANIKAD